MKKLLGVIGHPIAHSISPAMHGAALDVLAVDAAYVPFDVAPAGLADAVRGLGALGALGFNVTLPHKESIVPLLDAVEPDARAIGAVNTVVREDGRWIGANTDASGLARALAESGAALRGARVVIVGAGGAARAAAWAARSEGAAEIALAARRREPAERIARALGGDAIEARELAAIGSLERCDLLIQASSATLDPEAGRALAEALPLATLPASATVIDLVYRPRRTAVLAAAEALGLAAIDGLGMLVHQGALALERWLPGTVAPLATMRAAALRGLAKVE